MHATRRFDRTALDIPRARHFVRETLVGWGPSAPGPFVIDDVVLMASELFTNAVLHGDGHIDVVLRVDVDSLRITVSDEGPRPVLPLTLRAFPTDYPGGRGLRIVDQLAAAWGSGPRRGGGTEVWLEVPWSAR